METNQLTSARDGIILIGDSHVHTVLNGYAVLNGSSTPSYEVYKFGGGAADHKYHPMHSTVGGKISWNMDFVSDLVDCVHRNRPLLIAAAWGGNVHYVNGVINYPRPYDFVLPDAPNLPLTAGYEIIPYDLLYRLFIGPAGHLGSLWELLNERCGLPIYHLAAPPPVRSADVIASHLPPDWRPQAQALGLTSPHFRYKVWRLTMQLTEASARAAGVQFVWPPDAASDSDGLLLDAYTGDGIHGNTAYGALVASQLDSLVAASLANA
jgi:hypothetical protein